MRTINIRGKKWKLRLEPPDSFNDGVRDLGLCDYDSKTIYVNPDSPEFVGIVVHEILHSCFEDMSENAIVETEEAIVAGLETALEMLAKHIKGRCDSIS